MSNAEGNDSGTRSVGMSIGTLPHPRVPRALARLRYHLPVRTRQDRRARNELDPDHMLVWKIMPPASAERRSSRPQRPEIGEQSGIGWLPKERAVNCTPNNAASGAEPSLPWQDRLPAPEECVPEGSEFCIARVEIGSDYFHKVVDCQYACPAHPVPEYIRLIADGRTRRLHDQLEVQRLPGILGRTCDRPCVRPACRGRVEEEPVAICRLKRVAADMKSDVTDRMPPPAAASNGKRIALVGCGRPLSPSHATWRPSAINSPSSTARPSPPA